MKYAGSCLCGNVVFEIEGEFQQFFLCHCRYCRKDTGSAHAANLFSDTASIRWLSGQEQVVTYRLPDTRHQRSFCPSCGSALPGIDSSGNLVVPAGSMDTDIPIPPRAHIFTNSRANWDKRLDQIDSYGGLPK